jgi:acetyl-CoA carboxylase carboxyltransferase component
MTEKNAYMFITGPEVIRAVTHEDVDFDTLGSAGTHHHKSGVAHFTARMKKPAWSRCASCSLTCRPTT